MASREEVLAALAAVPGPDGRTPLPDSGAISGLTIRDGKVFLAIVVDPDSASELEPMRANAEAAIKATPGVTSAVVTLTAESARAVGDAAPGHRHGHGPAGGQQRQPRSTLPIAGVKHIIAVASGKGGVGKPTLACNPEVGFPKPGLKIGVLD